MLTRAQINAANSTLDPVAKLQLATAIRASSEYRQKTWLYPALTAMIDGASADQVRILNAGLALYESYGDGTDETTPTRTNNGMKSSVVSDREALIKYLLSVLYENVADYLTQSGANSASVEVIGGW